MSGLKKNRLLRIANKIGINTQLWNIENLRSVGEDYETSYIHKLLYLARC